VLGPWRVTKAFAPLLLESKGRVLTTGSLSGTATWQLGGAYSMSKHAVEAFTDTLALEVERFGVHVAVIEPGNYDTEIMRSALAGLEDKGGPGSRYERMIDRMREQAPDRSRYLQPHDVAAAFRRALEDEKPQRRYTVVPEQREAELLLRAALRRVAEFNRGHGFAFTRDALVAMLDAELARK
jgi:NAD(P)-dependent dehydrogenase (short-subunit alcohol dehydrogenase family)